MSKEGLEKEVSLKEGPLRVDEVYELLGSRGRAQMLYLTLISVSVHIVSSYQFLMPVFLLRTPSWTCLSTNCTKDLCEMPRDQWQWDNHKATMISDFELQCSIPYATLANSLFFVPGCVVGLVISGYASDRYGRKRTVSLFLFLSMLNSLAMAIAPSFPFFLVFRILMGVTCIGMQAVHMTYRDEFFPASKRPLCNFLGALFKDVGLLLLPIIDYSSNNWRVLNWASVIMPVIGLTLYFVPESPHWLLTNRSEAETKEVLKKIATINNNTTDIQALELVKVPSHREAGSILQMFKDVKTRNMVLRFFYLWFTASLLFYGFYYALGSLSGSFYINFAIMSVIEIPFYLLTAVLAVRYGRRYSLLANLILVTVCCLVSVLDLDFGKNWNLRRIGAILGAKWGGSSVFFIVYMYTNEVMPTSLRSTGLNMCSISARAGAFIAPYVIVLCQDLNSYIHFLVFAAMCVAGVGVAWGLPETRDQCLKTTIHGEDLRSDSGESSAEVKL